MNETFFTVLGYVTAVLIAWFAVTLPIALLLGRGIALADEIELGPQSDTEHEPWAPEDAAGLRYRQQRIAEALAEAEAQGFARGWAVWS